MFFLEENSSFSEIFLTYASKKQREEASRNNDLHPPKPKRNMGKRTFKYAGAIYFNSLPNYVKSATSVNSFKKMLTEYFTLQF